MDSRQEKDVTMNRLWTWSNIYVLDSDRGSYSGAYRCIDFDKYIWFGLVKSMCKKHRSVFQDHVKYIHNDIVSPSWL